MTIIYTDDTGPLVLTSSDTHDPNSSKYYYLNYRPGTRIPAKEYVKGVDIVIPLISNGCMYECISGGISDVVEPIFTTISGKITIELGGVQWKCTPLISRLVTGDAITASTWVGSPGVTIVNPIIITTIATGIEVTGVPPTDKTFTLTNSITILRHNGRTEIFDKSIIIPIGNL
jgi:hypothetical protein